MTFTPHAGRLDVAKHCVFPWTSRLPWPKFAFARQTYGQAVSSVAECIAVFGDAPLGDIADAAELTEGKRSALIAAGAAIATLLEEDEASWRVAEVTFAIDPLRRTGRRPLRAGVHDYSDQRDGEIWGAVDLAFVGRARLRDGRTFDGLIIRDYKTGRYTHGKRPTESWQLRALGAAAALALGHEEVCVQFVQVDDDGARPRSEVLDAWEIDVICGELADVLARIERGMAAPVVGSHCTESFCPIVGVCPAAQKALATIEAGSDLTFPFTPQITSPEHLAHTRRRLKMAERALETIDAACRAYVEEHGRVELEPGLYYGPKQHDGAERIDLGVAGARAAAQRVLGDHFDEAVELKTSKAALGRAARPVAAAQGRPIVRVTDELYNELRKLGAIRQGAPYQKIEEYKE